MATPATAAAAAPSELLPTEADKDLVRKIKGTHTHEMVIGLCGPIGAPTRDVALRLQAVLRDSYNYLPVIKKLSEFIERHSEGRVVKSSAYSRYTTLIDEGDRLRSTFGHSILAELAIADISIRRDLNRRETGSGEFVPERFCHIIDSIKNQEELNALRAVYGDLFVCIGVYASRDERENRLKKRQITEAQMTELIDRDSGEEKRHGQTVRDTFHLSDYFINCSSYNNDIIDGKLNRLIDIILGSKVITPSVDETMMYTAFTASLNSACLSRQVGASVADQDGNLLGIGWNDVPKFGGGLYGDGDGNDNRCHNFGGECRNDKHKDFIAEEIAAALSEEGLIKPDNKKDAMIVILRSRVKSLIEFSRAVHAEMLALLNAGRSGGQRMRGGKIYITTYPCHSCARHIIAAGIHEIFYIEPYRKSLALDLHDDALTEGGSRRGKVALVPFEGVSPTRYSDFFRMSQPRKEAGKVIEADPKALNFKAETSLKSLPMLEKLVVEKLAKQHLLPS